MEDKLYVKLGVVFDDESSEIFKEEIRKIVKDIIKEEIAKAVNNIPEMIFNLSIFNSENIDDLGEKIFSSIYDSIRRR